MMGWWQRTRMKIVHPKEGKADLIVPRGLLSQIRNQTEALPLDDGSTSTAMSSTATTPTTTQQKGDTSSDDSAERDQGEMDDKNRSSQLRTRHRYNNHHGHHRVDVGGHEEIPGDDGGGHGGNSGSSSRGRERYRRQRREQSRSPSQPPGTCPVGCAAMYYMLWILLGFVVYPFAISTHSSRGSSSGGSSSTTSTMMTKKQKKTARDTDTTKRLKVPRHSQDKNQQSLQFVFIAGLPGPGHGMLHDLIVKSPLGLFSNSGSSMSSHIQFLQDLLWPRAVPPLSLLTPPQTEATNSDNATLFLSSSSSNSRRYGLWNAHCVKDEMTSDLTTIMDEVVQRLQIIQRIHHDQNEEEEDNKSKKKSKNGASTNTTSKETVAITRIPINVLLPLQKDDGSYQQQQQYQDYSYMSFPNGFTGIDTADLPTSMAQAATSCRPLDHPNLDLLFHACEVADVDCKLMFLHQPPINVVQHQQQQLQLLQKRQQQRQTEVPMPLVTTTLSSPTISTRTLLPIIHLLTSMSSILTTDMFLFSDRIISCLDMDDRTNTKGRREGTLWSDTVFKLFWTDKDIFSKDITASTEDAGRRKQFDALLQSAISQHLSGFTNSEDFVPEQFEPYMNAYDLASDRAVEICKESLRENL